MGYVRGSSYRVLIGKILVFWIGGWLWEVVAHGISTVILLHEKFLQFDWLRAVVFQLNLKYLHVKITNLLRVVV